jgi:enoyl-CoA hydratase/carnithine racemase
MRGRGDPDVAGAVRFDLAGEPPRGFLSERLVERLLGLLQDQANACAVVLENRDAAFCLGLDPSLLTATAAATVRERARAALEQFDRLLRAIDGASCPVIAVVDGRAVGGGVALAAAADLVIATSRATFGLPETLLGVAPALAFPVIARRVGVVRARWLAMSGVTVDAAEAVRVGLVDVVAEEPEKALTRSLRRLSRLDPGSIAAVKRLATVYRGQDEPYKAAALETFLQLLERPETQTRLSRFAMGLEPWPDESDA